jgi:tetratricopeptide (TPR) repeat protein
MTKRILASLGILVLSTIPMTAGQAAAQGQVQAPAGQPRPKSQKELDALKKVQATAQAGDPKAELQAISDVLENFADTDFKPMLMAMGMDAAQRTGDYSQTLVWGERAVQAAPDDPSPRILMAETIAQHTRENDLDKDQSIKKVNDYANQGLDILKNANTPPAGMDPGKWPEIKQQLTSQGHDALGQALELQKKYPDAVKEFQSASTAQPTNSVAMARLAKAFVENKQYDDAISTADKVIAMNDAPAQVKSFAQTQKDNATKLKGGAAPPTPKP